MHQSVRTFPSLCPRMFPETMEQRSLRGVVARERSSVCVVETDERVDCDQMGPARREMSGLCIVVVDGALMAVVGGQGLAGESQGHRNGSTETLHGERYWGWG